MAFASACAYLAFLLIAGAMLGGLVHLDFMETGHPPPTWLRWLLTVPIIVTFAVLATAAGTVRALRRHESRVAACVSVICVLLASAGLGWLLNYWNLLPWREIHPLPASNCWLDYGTLSLASPSQFKTMHLQATGLPGQLLRNQEAAVRRDPHKREFAQPRHRVFFAHDDESPTGCRIGHRDDLPVIEQFRTTGRPLGFTPPVRRYPHRGGTLGEGIDDDLRPSRDRRVRGHPLVVRGQLHSVHAA